MTDSLQKQRHHMDTLARLMVCAWLPGRSTLNADSDDLLPYMRSLASQDEDGRTDFLKLANAHHVTVRALTTVSQAAVEQGDQTLADWCTEVLAAEGARIKHAVSMLQPVCDGLERQGCRVAVIKSLDHWPDLGSDLDLYTTADPSEVQRVMRKEFGASPVARSWGDRLAGKWNFQISGLPELVEIHVRYLGQTGEHELMARRIIDRRLSRVLDGHSFYVPAPEERIVISALQRVYRHFYFRLCDMAEMAALLRADAVDFEELRKAAELGGIWHGVATFLCLVRAFVESYGETVPLPSEVAESSYWPGLRVHFQSGFLRVPKLPAAGLYSAQLLCAGLHRDLRALCRLPLLPPLAVTALVAYRLTGDDKGIW